MSRPTLPLDPAAGPQPVPPAPVVQPTPAPPDSPLAGQLPAWDLVPAPTFIARRRPAR